MQTDKDNTFKTSDLRRPEKISFGTQKQVEFEFPVSWCCVREAPVGPRLALAAACGTAVGCSLRLWPDCLGARKLKRKLG